MFYYKGIYQLLLNYSYYSLIRKLNIEAFSDCLVVGIPIFHCFGRIGCFLSGCCYGIESEWGFTATNAIVNSCNHVNRFPVQFLEAGLNILLFCLLLLFFYKRTFIGNLIYIYLTIYSLIRFFDEFLRGDIYRGIWFGLSTSQWISICIFIFSIFMIFLKTKRKININKFRLM